VCCKDKDKRNKSSFLLSPEEDCWVGTESIIGTAPLGATTTICCQLSGLQPFNFICDQWDALSYTYHFSIPCLLHLVVYFDPTLVWWLQLFVSGRPACTIFAIHRAPMSPLSSSLRPPWLSICCTSSLDSLMRTSAPSCPSTSVPSPQNSLMRVARLTMQPLTSIVLWLVVRVFGAACSFYMERSTPVVLTPSSLLDGQGTPMA